MANVNDIKAAVTHLLDENEAIQLIISGQLDKLEELEQLHLELQNESAHENFPLMGGSLVEARQKLTEALEALDGYEDKGREYIRAI